MAAAKKTEKKTKEEMIEDIDQAEELEEVSDTEPNVDLPNEAVDMTEVGQGEPEELETDDAAEPKTTKAGKRSAKAIREAEEEEARQEAKEQPQEAPVKVVRKRQEPNPLHQHGKKYREVAKKVEPGKIYPLEEALTLATETATTKFDSSVEVHIGLGVDPRQADQMVRASVVLPHGTGRSIRVAVIAPEAKHAEAKTAGADRVGEADLLAEIEKGKLDFDLLIATPDMMSKLGKAAKVLGPRGLMPNPKSGSVTPDVATAVKQAKAGKVEFRIDKQAIVHQAVGKVSFKADDLLENTKTLISAVMNAKPSTTKGTYVTSMAIATTMGPGVKVDVTQAIALSTKR
jgi:large subunit ribosomal protein L1